MSTHLIQKILENNPKRNIQVAGGFESAIIGYDKFSNCIIYSARKCISILAVEEGMSLAQAKLHLKSLSDAGGSVYIEEVNDILNINLN